MTFRTLLLITLVSVSLAGTAAEQNSVDLAVKVKDLIKRLDDDDFTTRENATNEIGSLPAEALPLLQAALDGASIDVRTRIEKNLSGLKNKARHKERLAQTEKKAAAQAAFLRGIYDKGSDCNPKWDDAAHAALDLIGKWFAWPGRNNALFQDVNTACSKAVDAGCTDPLIIYGKYRSLDLLGKSTNISETLAKYEECGNKFMKTKYPAVRRLYPFLWSALGTLNTLKNPPPETLQHVQKLLDSALAQLPETLQDKDAGIDLRLDACRNLVDGYFRLEKDRKKGFDRVYPIAVKELPDSVIPHVLKAEVYVAYAWDARGGGWADSVTQDGWKLMGERLAEAEAAVEAAWKLDPKDAHGPMEMLKVELGQGKGRDRMEMWFKRAMEADPDCFEACSRKLYYLEPKWHGSPEDMLAFGRECLATQNWDARLPFILIDAHWSLSQGGNNREYFKQPGIFEDFRAVYEGALKANPNSWDRGRYAKYACWCEHWDVANEQFKLLGENPDVSAFKSRAEFDQLKATAAEKATKK